MKRSKLFIVPAGLCLLAAFIVATPAANEREEDETETTIAFDDLPEAVRTAVRKAARGAKVKEVEREMEDGRAVYEVELVVETEIEVELTEDGTIIGFEIEGRDDDEDADDD